MIEPKINTKTRFKSRSTKFEPYKCKNKDRNRMQRHRGKKLKTKRERNLLIFFISPSDNTPHYIVICACYKTKANNNKALNNRIIKA